MHNADGSWRQATSEEMSVARSQTEEITLFAGDLDPLEYEREDYAHVKIEGGDDVFATYTSDALGLNITILQIMDCDGDFLRPIGDETDRLKKAIQAKVEDEVAAVG